MAGAVEATLASINPSILKDSEVHEKVIAALKQTERLERPSISVQRALYIGLTGLFEKLHEADASGAASGPDVVDSLKVQLFRQDADSEAVRLLRTDAIVAAVKYSRSLAEGLRAEILEQTKTDPSSIVRDRLRSAAGAPQ